MERDYRLGETVKINDNEGYKLGIVVSPEQLMRVPHPTMKSKMVALIGYEIRTGFNKSLAYTSSDLSPSEKQLLEDFSKLSLDEIKEKSNLAISTLEKELQ